MKNLKAVLITFLICIFSINICFGGWEQEMNKLAYLVVFLIISAFFYFINIILIVWKKWIPWVIFSAIAFIVIDVIYFLSDQVFENDINIFAFINLVIFVFYLVQLYISFNILKKKAY